MLRLVGLGQVRDVSTTIRPVSLIPLPCTHTSAHYTTCVPYPSPLHPHLCTLYDLCPISLSLAPTLLHTIQPVSLIPLPCTHTTAHYPTCVPYPSPLHPHFCTLYNHYPTCVPYPSPLHPHHSTLSDLCPLSLSLAPTPQHTIRPVSLIPLPCTHTSAHYPTLSGAS